jgi:hypothetical protein
MEIKKKEKKRSLILSWVVTLEISARRLNDKPMKNQLMKTSAILATQKKNGKKGVFSRTTNRTKSR